MGFETYIATGKVTTLEHELGNDTVEGRARVSKALLAGTERAEVLDGLWDDVVIEIEVDAAGLLYTDVDVSMVGRRGQVMQRRGENRRGENGAARNCRYPGAPWEGTLMIQLMLRGYEKTSTYQRPFPSAYQHCRGRGPPK